jgi:hypothetical protein
MGCGERRVKRLDRERAANVERAMTTDDDAGRIATWPGAR